MKNKVDEEFGQSYWNLSYRGKLIRTLWLTPFLILAIIFYINSTNHIIITLVLIILYLWQLIYTYSKWKKEEKA
ncbi:hypothetical protein [Clostridium perfringens]|uniref:hypothetical protein n=1 Tax=Clostridium perfringens TaxID=1502 RepID=UPI001CCAD499|nr:hypothetical protein [Clostridium perfringens]UBK54488.1 hypothetical protein KLF47_07005 [Clostridium perfringens]